MSARSDELYLVDIIESADGLAKIISSTDRKSFLDNDTLRSAALWKLFVISEAACSLKSESRESLSNVPWDDLRGFRNRLAHGYFSLDWARVWEISLDSVPTLAEQARSLLRAKFPDIYDQLESRRNRTDS